MISITKDLIANGYAYEAGGDVYFRVKKFPQYGYLSKQPIDQLESGARIEVGDLKEDPLDFALWKKDEKFGYNSPWGVGRPGWHIECSAMSRKYLGKTIDIHAGGADLIFPHHENEMAQTRAAGYRTANRWMHSAWVTAKGEKMSKSLGNGLSVPVVLKEHSAWVVRYALGSVQYRSMLEWSDQTLAEAQAAYDRIMNFIEHAAEALGEQPSREEITGVSADDLPVDFVAAMNDDVNVSRATAAIFTQVRAGNTQLTELVDDAESDKRAALRTTLVNVRAMLDTLGLDPLAEPWVSGGGEAGGASAAQDALARLIDAQLEARAAASKAKDFAAADKIRDDLAALGITIEDGPNGSTWSLD